MYHENTEDGWGGIQFCSSNAHAKWWKVEIYSYAKWINKVLYTGDWKKIKILKAQINSHSDFIFTTCYINWQYWNLTNIRLCLSVWKNSGWLGQFRTVNQNSDFGCRKLIVTYWAKEYIFINTMLKMQYREWYMKLSVFLYQVLW